MAENKDSRRPQYEGCVRIEGCFLYLSYLRTYLHNALVQVKYIDFCDIHCILYCIPFAVVYGMDYRIAILFVMHVLADWEKCKGIIGYVEDQILHYAIAIALY